MVIFGIILALKVAAISCLYEDQIGKFDWRRRFVGPIVDVAIDNAEVVQRRAIVTTGYGVVASLSLKTGDILWRAVLDSKPPLSLTTIPDAALILANDGRILRGFDTNTGILLWEKVIFDKACNSAKLLQGSKNSAIIYSCSHLISVDSAGSVLWKQSFSDVTQIHYTSYVSSSNHLYVAGQSGEGESSIVIIKLDASNGKVLAKTAISYSVPQHESCSVLEELLVCFNKATGTIGLVNMESPTSVDNVQNSAAGEKVHLGIFGVNNKRYLVILTENKLQIFVVAGKYKLNMIAEKTFSGNLVTSSQVDDNLIFIEEAQSIGRSATFHVFNFASTKLLPERSTIIPLETDIGSIEKVWPIAIKRPSGSGAVDSGYRYFVLGKDHSCSLVAQSGRVIWSRQEALASILETEMIDFPLSQAEQDIETEFTTADESMISLFIKRITSQAIQVQHATIRFTEEAVKFLGSLNQLMVSKDGSIMPVVKSSQSSIHSGALERDYFNLNKMIVIVTSVGKVFGIDSRQGEIVWQSTFAGIQPLTMNKKPTFPFYILRTTAHYPHPPEAIIIGRGSSSAKNHAMVVFNPITGALIKQVSLDCTVEQSLLLPHVTANDSHVLLLLCSNDKVVVYPPEALQEVDASQFSSVFAFTVDPVNGFMNGYRIEVSGNEAKKVSLWKTKLLSSPKEAVTSVKLRRSGEMRVHSQGRVLGDRSVLFKYLNPNLAAVVLESFEPGKSAIIVYLIDTVTGQVIAKAVHKKANGPVHLLHCENWLVYSYWNEKARRTELAVLELFEGYVQSNPDRFSSLEASSPPIISRQAYVFPQGVSAMAVTETEKGITTRHILIAMPFGGILQLPKMFLDPRRPLFPTMEHREEGLVPYIPELPVATEHILNYNQTIINIRGIYTAASGLESTSLVLAYGLDLFFTRITPSGTFDILKDDFDHWLIAAVLTALLMASVITKKLARHRDLQAAWK